MKKYTVLLALVLGLAMPLSSHSYAKRNSWIYLCNNTYQPVSKRKCALMYEAVSRETGKFLIRIMVSKRKKRVLVIYLPRKFDPARGLWLRVDKATPFRIPFKSCGRYYCRSGGIVRPKLQRMLLRGSRIVVTVRDRFGTMRGFRIPLGGYTHIRNKKPVSMQTYFRARRYISNKLKKERNEKMFERLFGF